jgi:hypothetical protein
MNAPTLRRFESIQGFGLVGNLYEKMHFAGSNLSTDPKFPINTGKLEGFNNKIKVTKRNAYGFRNLDFFFPISAFFLYPEASYTRICEEPFYFT